MKNSEKQTKQATRKTIDKRKQEKQKIKTNETTQKKHTQNKTKQNKRKKEHEKKNYVVSLNVSCYWMLVYILLPQCFMFVLGADLKRCRVIMQI